MNATGVPQLEQNIARCRIALSIAAIAAVYIDPAEPLLSRWIPLTSGPFVMDLRLAAFMLAHFAYAIGLYVALRRGWIEQPRVVLPTIWIDVLFGAAIGTLTEGITSPAYPFFAFAVLAGGLRAGARQALWVTAASVAVYEGLILVSTAGGAEVYIMRPVYLAITGYLVGYLGQQWLDLQDEMRQLEISEQRSRIARDLHDNFAQALAGINLRLESCRRKLGANPGAEVLPDLTELQESVRHEYDELRSFTRALAGLEVTAAAPGAVTAPLLSLRADISGSLDLVDHVLQIAREGIANVRRHARASNARIDIQAEPQLVRVRIEDDGVGFQNEAPPWSIASRVREFGGLVQVVTGEEGGRLVITVPHAGAR
jgi:signal transduction histidine kinase